MITTKFYLDTRRISDDKPASLKISITYNRKVSYLSTGFKIQPSLWDGAALAAKDRSTQLSISRLKLKVDTIILDMLEAGRLDGLDAAGIKELVERELSPKAKGSAKFLPLFKEYGESRKKLRTREIYAATLHKIEQFEPNAERLFFADINTGWLDRFDSFLALTSPKKNARNIHLRNIRAVINEARRKGITAEYPFITYKVKPESTRHRALSIEDLRKLFNAKVPEWKQKYLDFFKLSFFLIGMNTEDLLHATTINGDRLEYIRAKTYKPYSIKIEPECMELLQKYKGEKYLLNILDTYSSTRIWTSKVNHILKGICEDIGIPGISMYWARHSWITIATNLDIPDRTVSASAGHSSKSVTDIYIDFDRAKIDKANRQVLDYVLKGKKAEDLYELMSQIGQNVAQMMQESRQSRRDSN